MTRNNLRILIGGAWACVIEKRDDEGPPAFDTFVPPPEGYEIISNAVVPLVQVALAELAEDGRLA